MGKIKEERGIEITQVIEIKISINTYYMNLMNEDKEMHTVHVVCNNHCSIKPPMLVNNIL